MNKRSEARAARAAASGSSSGESTAAGAGGGIEDLFVDGLSMGAGYERISSRLFKIDPWAEYERLETALKLGTAGHRAEYSTLVDALEEAESNALTAHALYVNAKVALEAFEIDAAAIDGGMRERARADLNAMKERGELAKAPTIADIEAHMASKFTDEYRDLAMRRQKAKRMVDHMERLADLWRDRRRTLETMVQRAR